MMKQYQHYFKKNIKKIELTTLGLTNKIFHVYLEDNSEYHLRIPYDHNDEFFNYELEQQIISEIDKLKITLPTVFFNTEKGIKISPYFKNLKVLNETNLDLVIENVANKIKTFHSAPLCHHEFNIKKKYETFKQLTLVSLYDLSTYEFIMDNLKCYSDRVLCHNDLVNGNVVFLNNECFLIDFEYASDNHPYFDLMSFITENNIDDPNLREGFFTAYFGTKLTDEIIQGLLYFESVHNLLWCQWAMMQYSILKEDIYFEIATDKYNRLVNIVKPKV